MPPRRQLQLGKAGRRPEGRRADGRGHDRKSRLAIRRDRSPRAHRRRRIDRLVRPAGARRCSDRPGSGSRAGRRLRRKRGRREGAADSLPLRPRRPAARHPLAAHPAPGRRHDRQVGRRAGTLARRGSGAGRRHAPLRRDGHAVAGDRARRRPADRVRGRPVPPGRAQPGRCHAVQRPRAARPGELSGRLSGGDRDPRRADDARPGAGDTGAGRARLLLRLPRALRRRGHAPDRLPHQPRLGAGHQRGVRGVALRPLRHLPDRVHPPGRAALPAPRAAGLLVLRVEDRSRRDVHAQAQRARSIVRLEVLAPARRVRLLRADRRRGRTRGRAQHGAHVARRAAVHGAVPRGARPRVRQAVDRAPPGHRPRGPRVRLPA